MLLGTNAGQQSGFSWTERSRETVLPILDFRSILDFWVGEKVLAAVRRYG